jgi:hypothetical protein
MPSKWAVIYDDVKWLKGAKSVFNAAGAKARELKNLASNFWMKATIDGFIALADGARNAAAHMWLEAAAHGVQDGPVRAAAHNNVGIAHLIGSRPREAVHHLAMAEQCWENVRARVPSLDVSIGARSSAFHLRLAMEHPEALAELRRRRYIDLCGAGKAIAGWNEDVAGAVAEGRANRAEEGVDLTQTIAVAFGPGCPDVELLGDRSVTFSDSVRAAYRNKADFLLQRFAVTYVPGDDAADIDRAAHMTALLHPSLLTAGSTAEGAQP